MRFKSTFAAAALLAVAAAFMALPSSAQQPQAERVAPVCANCHPQSLNSILMTAHGAESDAKGTQCQACHGDATQHLQDPKKYKPVGALASATATATEKSAVCLSLPRRPAAARELVRRQAPQGRRDVRQLPQRPPDAVGGQHQADPLRRVRGRAVHDDVPQPRVQELRRVPPRHARGDPEAVAPPDRRRQGHVPGLPRPARLAQQVQHQGRVDARPVRQLPRRQARPVDPRASARDGELRHLPHAARLGAPRPARAEAAGAVCRLPPRRPHARHLRRPRASFPTRCRPTSASRAVAASSATGKSTAATRRPPPSGSGSFAEIRGST